MPKGVPLFAESKKGPLHAKREEDGLRAWVCEWLMAKARPFSPEAKKRAASAEADALDGAIFASAKMRRSANREAIAGAPLCCKQLSRTRSRPVKCHQTTSRGQA